MQDALLIALRTLMAIVVLFLLTKLLGKRQVSQLSVFEYITGITLGSLAAYISLDLGVPWYLGFVSLAVWGGFSFGIELLQLKSKKARDWIDGKATVLIQEGNILENNLKRERLTLDELLQQLRKKNVFNAADVEFAVMEASGVINVLLKNEKQPLTPKELGMKLSSAPVPQTVIMSGNVVNEALASAGRNRKWLDEKLEHVDLRLEEVFLGQVDSSGELHVDLYDSDRPPQPKSPSPSLQDQLQACESDLAALRVLYEQCSARLKRMIEEVKPTEERH